MKSALAFLIAMIVILLGTTPVRAANSLPLRTNERNVRYDGPESWVAFEEQMKDQERKDQVAGISYMVSGGIATLGGIAGAQNSTDVLSRGIFAISQTLGVAALGYGASLYWNGNDYASFYRAVRDSSLSSAQKTELLQKFLANERAQNDRSRWIHITTHGLLAAVNFYSASQEENKDVRSLLQLLGVVNVVIAFTW